VKFFLLLLLLLLLALCTQLTFAARNARITTGPENGTYVWMGSDLSKYVAKPASINLDISASQGSVDNIKRLSFDPDTQLGLVQSDVFQAYLDQAQRGNTQAARLINPLRIVLPLHEEEVYFVVRIDSPLNTLHDIQNKRINIGPLTAGAALTATTLYQLIFGEPMASANASTHTSEEALGKLVTDQSIDVVVVLAGQPVPLFLGMEPSVEKNFKLLQLDERHAGTQRAMKTYATTVIKAANYPAWLKADMPAFATKTFLVARDLTDQKTNPLSIPLFTKSLCANWPLLQKEGHPKWRQVSLQLPPLERGWKYHPLAEREIRQCLAHTSRPASTPTLTLNSKPLLPKAPTCTWSDKVMGLCGGAGR
jgi:uncharacterized protein